MTKQHLSRRKFLATGLGGALTIAVLPGCSLPVFPKRPQPEHEQALGWISHKDNHYTLTLPRSEIGQNITTALKQIACEELEVEWDQVTVTAHDTLNIDRVKSTVGSESVKDFAEPLAQACASLRDALRTGQTEGELTVSPRPLSELISFRNGKAKRFVGKPALLDQGKEIVTGQPLYATDMRHPNMVYGRVLYAPSACDLVSTPLSWTPVTGEEQAGFISIVESEQFIHGQSKGLGIIAETPGALDRIEEAMDVKWVTENLPTSSLEDTLDIDQRLDKGSLSNSLSGGDLSSVKTWDIDLRIDIPAAAHNAIEPRAALAYEEDGILHVWTGTQDAFYVRDVIAKAVGRDDETICVHTCRVGGGFGGKTLCFAELEAALLTLAINRPVKVQWTRQQEYAQAFHRPPSSHRFQAAISEGKITHWHHAFASGHILFTNAGVPEWLQKATDLVGDMGVARGAVHPYHFPEQVIEYDLERLPIFTGPWRGLGAAPNGLALEIAMNECAKAAQQDPVQFRLDQMSDHRLIRVCRDVTAQSRWREGHTKGRGFACGIYKEKSYVAVVADVERTADGGFTVTHMWASHDCGKMINPDQIKSQCEGNMIWGLGMVFSDNLIFSIENVTAELFADAPIPKMDQTPDMKINLIESNEPPAGAGETAIVAAGAAIANAISSLTGKPITKFPLVT